MPHPRIDNQTPFFADFIPVVDEEFRPHIVVRCQASFDIRGHGIEIAEEQEPCCSAAQFNILDDENSSPQSEPDFALEKLSTDIIVSAHAWAPRMGTTQLDVGISVGSVQQVARVFGDRRFYTHLGAVSLTSPLPFEKIPLIYEHAFGGTHQDGSFDPRNPVGKGWRAQADADDARAFAANIESLHAPITTIRDLGIPVGFGILPIHWPPRSGFVGTYDDNWSQSRAPKLPIDFDRRSFNAASPGLISPTYLRGDELVRAQHMGPQSRLEFRLPGIQAPSYRASLRGRPDVAGQTVLDTLIVDLDRNQLQLVWRGSFPTKDGIHDLVELELTLATGLPSSLQRQVSAASMPVT